MATILSRKPGGSGGGGGGGAPSGPAGGSLGGTYPNPSIAADAVGTSEIAANAVGASELADNAVDTAAIAAGAVTAAKVAADVATQAELDAVATAAVAKALYDANTVLAATADDTPAAVTMGASTILARLAAGNIKAASVAEILTLLGVGTVLLYDSGELGGDAASIDITGLSGAYKHLRVVASLRSSRAAQNSDQGNIRFNGDTGGNYYSQDVFASGVAEDGAESLAATSFTQTSWPAATADAGFFAQFEATIANYASSTMRKSMSFQNGLFRGKTTGLLTALIGTGWWDSAAAITQLTFYASNGNVLAGSRVTVYGLA